MFFEDLLGRRRLDAADPDHPLGKLALSLSAEIVLQILDASENLKTPDPTTTQLAYFGLAKFYGRLCRSSRLQ